MNFLLRIQHNTLRLGCGPRRRVCKALRGPLLVRQGSNFKFVSDWLCSFGPIEIGDETIILKKSCILCCSIVATAAVATKYFLPYLIIGDTPASLIRLGWDEVIFSCHEEMFNPEGCRADSR